MNNIIKYATNEQLEALINNNSTLEAYEKYQYLTKEVKSIISMDNGVERDELLNQFLQDNEDFIEYNLYFKEFLNEHGNMYDALLRSFRVYRYSMHKNIMIDEKMKEVLKSITI